MALALFSRSVSIRFSSSFAFINDSAVGTLIENDDMNITNTFLISKIFYRTGLCSLNALRRNLTSCLSSFLLSFLDFGLPKREDLDVKLLGNKNSTVDSLNQ